MGSLQIVRLNGCLFGYPFGPTPNKISPEVMRALLGGEFPDTGFRWEYVIYFKLEDGVWEPYGDFDEILPAAGFKINVETIAC